MSTPAVFSSAGLLEAARSAGYATLPEIVEALTTVLERGHHLALVSGEGSGVELLFGLAAALRCNPEREELQALVIAGTREAVLRDARVVHAVAGPSGVTTRVWEGAGTGPCHLACGRPTDLLAGIRSGRLGLGELRLLVLDGMQDFETAGGWPAAEAILDTLEAETQRIACSVEPDARFRRLVDRRLPRARTWPPELFPSAGEEAPTASRGARRAVWTLTGTSEAARVERLIAALREPPGGGSSKVSIVRCADEATTARVQDMLAVHGFSRAEEAGQAGVFVGHDVVPTVKPDLSALFGLPLDLATLRAWLEPAGCAMACVEPREIAQLEIMLRRIGWTSKEAGWPLPPETRDAIEDYRSKVREGAGRADPVSQLSLLAPLLEELGPLSVIAALSEMVRRGETEAPAVRTPTEPAVSSAWTSVFLNVGKKDGAGPGDIVGAITGETPAVAAQIGKIDVRANHAIVELDSLVADEVIAALQGSRIKGRSVSAKRDREAGGTPARRPRRGRRGA